MLFSPALPPLTEIRPGQAALASFGSYPMTRRQHLARMLMHERPLGRGRLRRIAVSWFQQGPQIVDGTLFGYRVRFYPRDNQTDAYGAICGGFYKRRELRWLRSILSPDASFVDIGANMGFFSLYAARCHTRKILAVEANPVLIARFRETLALNEPLPIWCVSCAVGATSGNGELRSRHHDLGSFQISDTPSEKTQAGQQAATIPIRPLKDIVQDAGLKTITLMKLDIEGMEHSVLDTYFRDVSPMLYPQHLILERPVRREAQQALEHLLIASSLYRISGRTRANLLLSRNPS
ncbi:FkbM family methyltransferase [Acetobacter senegalensis]|uniref:FkbM family methyltransferase n=1 Tax=Acetobacter TaxID=434 RepID=UPI001EDA09A4|nr:FkbM family methyltransferase [Acetobacter senegalensis]MCP1195064.1 FkbM family methyltransferase [Acetobacter senegalensis]